MKYIDGHFKRPEFTSLTWFNLGIGGPAFWLFRRPNHVWIYNLFCRFCEDGFKQFGAGLLQINSRSLLYVGITNRPESRCGRLSLGFLFMRAEFFCEPGEQP